MRGPNCPPGVYFALVHGKSFRLYDSEEQQTCYGEIPLHPDAIVELYPKTDFYIDEVCQKDFPICLARNKRSLFIYCGTNNEKEEWFYALRKAANPHSLIYIQRERAIRQAYFEQAAEAVSGFPQLAWLNSLMARMLYHQINSKEVVELIKVRFLRRLAITPIPFFVGGVELREVSLGMTSPLITDARHHYTNGTGEVLCSFNILYDAPYGEGGYLVIHTVLKLDSMLTGGWMVPVNLLIRAVRLRGRIQVLLKAPPTDRLWYAFTEKPQLELAIDSNSIGLNAIKPIVKTAIEKVVLDGIEESMLVPSYSDIPIPPRSLWERFPL